MRRIGSFNVWIFDRAEICFSGARVLYHVFFSLRTSAGELLKEVRETGIAYDNGERYEDAFAIATPIFNYEKLPVAAVVIAGPAFRMTPLFIEEIVEPLKRTALEISRRLHY